MTEGLKYTVFNSAMGWVGILASAWGIRGTTLPQRSSQEARQLLGYSVNQAAYSPHLFDDCVERLKSYFDGHEVAFDDKIDLSKATSFQRRVWETTRLIPYGETRSYRWVAEQIKRPRAARAVGQALGRNPLPIIVPCHRVIAINGSLGGFNGGIQMKKLLLSLEASTNKR
jgi:methylated-DNA-[protein]-cysteine S-methyltransferase